MRTTLLIARRELSAYFRTMSGYVIAGLMLLIVGLLFNVFCIGGPDKLSAEVLSQFFFWTGGFSVVAGLFLSMRLLAEERQTGTLVLLTSSPVHDWQIVIGKFLSAFVFLTLIVASTIYMPLLVLVNGKVSFGQLAAGYLGVLLFGSTGVAIGTFGSAIARNQVLAVIFSSCIALAMTVAWMLGKVTEHPLNDVFVALALYGRHFPPFQAGSIHVRDVIYYVAVSYVALFASIRVMEARRWR
jgi:ABC-2 type transport system permease protein